jgi:long-chain acyl-CoA synthetase
VSRSAADPGVPLMSALRERWAGRSEPFVVQCGHASQADRRLSWTEVDGAAPSELADVAPGDVVGLVGELDARSISRLLHLIERGAVVVPLARETAAAHPWYCEVTGARWLIDGDQVTSLSPAGPVHSLVMQLRAAQRPGLVLFSSGTTGRPKAILHDLGRFLARFQTPRPTLCTLGFLMFDHIGGLNTLLHTLFNRGRLIVPSSRQVHAVLDACRRHDVELLPATPTFLRLLLLSGSLPDALPPTLRLVTWGTERMDASTLHALAERMPGIDLRQTYGMSELGILRVRSQARDSLFMQVGGEGVSTRVVDGILQIRADSRMLGYLNAPSPFDAEGWYDSGDRVDQQIDAEGRTWLSITGRRGDLINVGGLKFMASEVERVALTAPGVLFAAVHVRRNPITGQHVELDVQPAGSAPFDLEACRAWLNQHLPPHMRPRRVRVTEVAVNHRFKREGGGPP